MAISEAFNGTNSSWATEYFLASASTSSTPQTADGCYQLALDLSALADGDTYRVRCTEKVRSGGTARIVFEEFISGVQTAPNWFTPALILMHGWEFSITCTLGTDSRAIEWSIRKVA